MTNVQILQQAVLLKFKSFYAFLLEHSPDKAAEVAEAYNTTMSAIFLRHFRAHVADLAKCRVECVRHARCMHVRGGRCSRLCCAAPAPLVAPALAQAA